MGKAPHPVNITLGVLLIVAPWFFAPRWVALPLTILGVWVSLVALGPKLEIVTHEGKRHRTGVCLRHQFDADLYVEVVTDLAAADHPDT